MTEQTNHKEMRTRGDTTHRRFLPSKKIRIAAGVLLLAGLLVYLIGTGTVPQNFLHGKDVSFTQLKKDEIPQAIEKDVIPEYRDLERALGCMADGKVYVIVTRGEKPTAGYQLSIEKILLEKTKDGKSNMVVTALFREPSEGETVSRIITYPYVVAETELTGLPDTIELSVRYAE